MREGQTLLIGGTWRGSSSGAEFTSTDPADGSTVLQCALATAADVDGAVESARAAFESPDWRQMAPALRARLLWRLADLVEANLDELAVLETRDQGQPVGMVRAVGVPLAAEQLRYYAGWCTKLNGSTHTPSVPGAFNYTRREPIGVCVLFPTWNFPLMSAAGKLGPALAAGNTVIIKPADYTPATAIRLCELAAEAGFPDGVINCLTGDADTSRALVEHLGVESISFTGSTVIGRDIAQRAAPSFKRLTLELGGKAPSIVTAEADIDAAVLGNLQAAFLNSGQVCAAYTRLYVHASREDEFTTKFSKAASSMRLGPGLEESTQLGPLVSERQLERVAKYVAAGISEGAGLVVGGSRADGALATGSFYTPTVFSGVTDGMTIAREEIFGPVAAVLTYHELDEVVARANDSEYGLDAAVWTADLSVAHRIAEQLDVGTVYLNMLPALDAAVPWGGFKASGIGKEMGVSGIGDLTREKSVWVNLA
jgi:acyl-CoA reductase-like NAD-dependent aldehyde dehydrogenase